VNEIQFKTKHSHQTPRRKPDSRPPWARLNRRGVYLRTTIRVYKTSLAGETDPHRFQHKLASFQFKIQILNFTNKAN
jgi:hypothetical protein